MKIKCPYCGKNHTLKLNDLVPVQKFDINCQGLEREVTSKIIKQDEEKIIRTVEWD
jgi:hypothetical protein